MNTSECLTRTWAARPRQRNLSPLRRVAQTSKALSAHRPRARTREPMCALFRNADTLQLHDSKPIAKPPPSPRMTAERPRSMESGRRVAGLTLAQRLAAAKTAGT